MLPKWRCTDCRTLYAARLYTCPRCKSVAFFMEEPEMPKITVNQGPTFAPGDENYVPIENSESVEPEYKDVDEVVVDTYFTSEETETVAKPAINSPKSDWVVYAIHKDPNRDVGEIEAFTKVQLITRYS